MKTLLKTFIVIFILSLNLNAKEMEALPILTGINIDHTLGDNTKLEIDCSFTTSKLNGLFSTNIKNYTDSYVSLSILGLPQQSITISTFLTKICSDSVKKNKIEDEIYEVKYIDIINTLKDTNINISQVIKAEMFRIVQEELNTKETNILIKDKISHLELILTGKDNNLEYSIYLKILEITEPLDLKLNITLPYSDISTISNITLNKYKYNLNTEEIVEFNTTSKDYLSSFTVTNTYNIDIYEECINGNVWNKKYGQLSGKTCHFLKN